ncbi:PLP-dependent aminotransferase family protein [Variovorax boronicumulans]|uniref:aminotransferase-like domain-containing protein n=1 Tax=Variovorax boronicumulans TaxID=436515 RepID=UPI003394C49E
MKAAERDPAPVMPTHELARSALHPSLGEPVLGAINFLNEIIDRFPEAISFAPGAPAPALLEPIDVAADLETYVAHLCSVEGLSVAQVRRRLFQYGPSRGIINGLIADALARDQGIEVPPAAIVVTVGFQEAMLLALRAIYSSPADVLVVAQPCFAGAVGAARVLGIDVHPVDEDGEGLDVTELRALCTRLRLAGQRVRAVYVAPDHANPSGALMTRARREALLALAAEQDLFLFEDATYGFTAEDEETVPTLKALDRAGRVLHMGTFAKIAMPGVRVGFVVADQRVEGGTLLADALATLKSMTTVNTSPVCQAIVGGMLLKHGVSLSNLGRAKGSYYRARLDTLLAALTRHVGDRREGAPSWNHPSGGFFVRVRVPAVVDAALLEVSAREYGVLWTPMSLFYLGGGGQHELRLSCSYLTDAQIDEGAARLACFLRDARVCA